MAERWTQEQLDRVKEWARIRAALMDSTAYEAFVAALSAYHDAYRRREHLDAFAYRVVDAAENLQLSLATKRTDVAV